MKNKTVAIILAAIPGLGHFYLGLYKRGLMMIGLNILSLIVVIFIYVPLLISKFTYNNQSFFSILFGYILGLPAIAIYCWSMIDAYHQADKINIKLDPFYKDYKSKKA